MNPEWFYSVGDTRQGPVTEDELKRLADDGTLKPSDLVWKDGMADWVEARTIDILFPRAVSRRSEDDYVPTSRRRSDEDDLPRSRSRPDDEDRPRSRRDDYDDNDRPRSRRTYDDRDDYDDAPRRRQKPGQVQAVAIMLLVGGILEPWGLAYVVSRLIMCCLWPGIYIELVSAFWRSSGLQDAWRDDRPPDRWPSRSSAS